MVVLRSRRLPAVVLAVLVLLGILVVAALVYDHSKANAIASGVKVGGISVGGLSKSKAETILAAHLKRVAGRPVKVHAAGHTFTLTAKRAKVSTGDPSALADQAVKESRHGSIFTRVSRELTGGSVNAAVPVPITYSKPAVSRFVKRIAKKLDRDAKEASVTPSASGLQEVASHNGRRVSTKTLRQDIQAALGSLDGNRTIRAHVHTVKPKTTTAELAAKYPGYIIVDRDHFTLRFYEHLKPARTFPIAVGMQGLETPAGLYDVQWKQTNPSWYVPKSAWAGALAGKVIPPGPQDPIKARWMAFNGGAGIHGIDPSEYGSIGHDASHGCVRMRIPDVIWLYDRSPVGTPVYVA
jgi:lipoprotein-anchoring transpeptidase ErfK/SrfK